MIKVTQVVASSIGGAAEHIWLLANSLDRNVFTLHVIMPDDGGYIKQRLESIGVQVTTTLIFNSINVNNVKAIRKMLVDTDIVHFHGIRAAMVGRIALIGVIQRPKIIYTIHGLHYAFQSPLRKFVSVMIDRGLSTITNHTICVSKGDRTLAEKLKVAKPNKTSTIINGLDIEEIKRKSFFNKADLTFLNGKRSIVSVARFHEQKGIEYLISAFGLLVDEYPDVSLLLVGDGPKREQLLKISTSLGLEDKVHFLGYRDDAYSIIRRSELFVLPSLWEGLPLTLIEAMFLRIPVVATQVSGNDEVVEDGVTGLLVPPKDPKSLALAIKRLLDDPGFAKKLAIEAAEMASVKFSHHRMVAETETIYRLVIGG